MENREDERVHFLARIEKSETGCWEWTGAKYPTGYSRFLWKSTSRYAHRVAYELFIGEIPEGLCIDHLCRNNGCVNPDHLEAVTQAENVRRGNAGLNFKNRTHCPQGHFYDEANTRMYRGHKYCRECGRRTAKAYMRRIRSKE